MPFPDDMALDRRALLALAGAAALGTRSALAAASGVGTGAVPDEARPRHAELLTLLAKAHARLDGEAAFWISRGREYGVIDGRFAQIYERHVISATRAQPVPGGGLKISYTESAYATAAGDIESRPELASPFDGKPFPNPLVPPLKMTLNVSTEGVVMARVQTPKVLATYDGRVETQLGPDGVPLVDCAVQISSQVGDNHIGLFEVGPYAADWQAERKGYVPARRVVTVYRPLPLNISGGATGVMIGVHASTKHASFASLQSALMPSEARQFTQWFDTWRALWSAPEDFAMSGGERSG